MQTIVTLVWCKSPDSLYGCTSTLKTIRTGFPDARLFVFDNQCELESALEIAKLTKEAGGELRRLQQETKHWEWLTNILLLSDIDGTVIVLDPDLMFWKNCSDWNLGNAVFGGPYVPTFLDPFSRCVTLERLHTSFLVVPSIEKFRDCVDLTIRAHWEWHPFRPFMWKEKKQWFRIDTAGALYQSMLPQLYKFNTKELSSFDHLFCGSQIHLIKNIPELNQLHDAFKQDPNSLRGAWKTQLEFFRKHAP